MGLLLVLCGIFNSIPGLFPVDDNGGGLVAHSCPTLCHPMDCSLPGSSVHGILQARILEWLDISFFRTSSQPRN